MKKTPNKNEPVHVRFFIEESGTALAVFPTLWNTDITKQCYSSIGQHSGCSQDYISTLKEATHEQYADLKKELEQLGYLLIVVKQLQKGDSITIIGRRWFDRVNGNTYFSSVALVNNVQVCTIEFEYGYDEQYLHSMFNKLYMLGYCGDREIYKNGATEVFWRYCQRKEITKYVTKTDVNRKKDL